MQTGNNGEAGIDGPEGGARKLPAPVSGRGLSVSPEGYGYGTVAYADHSQGENEFVILARRLLAIALKWRYLIVGAAGAFLAVGLVYSFLTTPLYSATVRIQIDREAGKVVSGDSAAPSETGNNDFQRTQHELLRSRAISERAVSTLGLDQKASAEASMGLFGAIFALFASAPSEEEQAATQERRRAQTVRRVQGNVDIRPVRGSRLVDIVFTDPSPMQAASIANAYADAYVAANLDKRFEASAYAKVFLEDQIKQLKLRLEDAERALITFAESENMVQTNDKVSIAESNLAAANVALGTLISNRMRDEQSWRQVESSTAINLPQLLTNSVIDGLRAQRNVLRRDYEEKLETFRPSYPEMVQISKKISEIDRQLVAEVSTIRSSLKAAYEASATQETQMQKRIEELRAEVIDLQKKSVRYGILQREVESSRNIYNSLLQRYKEVDVASGVGTNNIFIVDRALPGARSHPRTMLILAGAFALGLAAGFGSATLIELFDDRIRTPDDAEKATGLPILGVVPYVELNEGLLPELGDPRSGIAEAYRSLATSLQFSTEAGLPRSLVVTSGGPAEGKSSTAIALARHFAITGKKVLLVDADLRRPSLHNKLELANANGLSNVLTGMLSINDVIQTTTVDNLWFIGSGPLPPNAAELLGGTQIFSFIAVGLEVFDLIIFDSPPMLGLADAQLLGAAASATIFVTGSGQARRGLVQNALRRLQLARAMPIGVVLTKFNAAAAQYGYGYGYHYGYQYGDDDQLGQEKPRKLRLPSIVGKAIKFLPAKAA